MANKHILFLPKLNYQYHKYFGEGLFLTFFFEFNFFDELSIFRR